MRCTYPIAIMTSARAYTDGYGHKPRALNCAFSVKQKALVLASNRNSSRVKFCVAQFGKKVYKGVSKSLGARTSVWVL